MKTSYQLSASTIPVSAYHSNSRASDLEGAKLCNLKIKYDT